MFLIVLRFFCAQGIVQVLNITDKTKIQIISTPSTFFKRSFLFLENTITRTLEWNEKFNQKMLHLLSAVNASDLQNGHE